MLRRLSDLPVRIDHEFVRDSGVEAPIALRRLVEADDLDVDDVGDGQPIPQDRLHQLPVVPQHRRLAGVEAVRPGPAEPETKPELATLRGVVLRSRISVT